jgi:hypothetical protein
MQLLAPGTAKNMNYALLPVAYSYDTAALQEMWPVVSGQYAGL